MRLWKMEFYKIAARPVMGLGFFLIVGFLVLITFQEANISYSEIDGTAYKGLEAIRADRELAKEYEGAFTAQKAEDMIKRFGFSGYVKDVENPIRREGNYCSQFVTDSLTDFRQTGEKPEGFSGREDWAEPSQKYCVSGHIRFGYAAGWKCLQEMWKQAVTYLNIWMIVMAAPVFSEEYSRKTAAILLSTERGKAQGIWGKITAALSLGLACYVSVMGLLFGLAAMLFGLDGLDASASMVLEPLLWQAFPESWSVAHILWLLFFKSMDSMLLNVCIVLFLSSRCQRTVSAVTAGVALFVLPYFVNGPVFSLLLDAGGARHYVGWLVLRAMRIFSFSMPMYLPLLEDMAVPVSLWQAVPWVVAGVAGVGIWRAYANYRNYHP